MISGYARLLRDGRLGEDDRAQALIQIERAAARLVGLSREASDMGRWLSKPDAASGSACQLDEIIEAAITRSAAADKVAARMDQPGASTIVLQDPAAVSAALGGIIDAVAREALDDSVQVRIGPGSPPHTYDVVVGPSEFWQSGAAIAGPDASEPVPIGRGGLGLALVLAVIVLEQHHARVWAIGPDARAIGVRFIAAP